MVNTLYFGDNLHVLREYVKDETVDLIYLDPPFNSNAQYNVLFRSPVGDRSTAQVQAFEDTWRWGQEAETAIDEVARRSPDTFNLLASLRLFLGESDVMAYLAMMAPRLLELRRVLKPTGSLYLHCDPTASHFLKILLDGIFGASCFRNEVIWKRSSAHNSAKRFGPVHDILFFYTKSDRYTWNPIYQPLPQETADAWYNNIEGDTGRRFNRADLTAPGVRTGPSGGTWRGIDVSAKGRHWAIPGFVGMVAMDTLKALDTLDAAGRLHWPKSAGGMPMLKRYIEESKGIPAQDVITDIPPLNNVSAERLGYPTQKPLALLERLILGSSNRGDVVLDPFCGCGTAVHAADKLGRAWIGIDVTYLAIQIIEDRLKKWMPGARYSVMGIPTDELGARALARRDPHGFQDWAVARLGGRSRGKGADRGIDGEILFKRGRRDYGRSIVSVKAVRNPQPAMLRELRGTVEREKAASGYFVCLDRPTREMEKEALRAGMADLPAGRRPRLQIVTMKQLLGKYETGLLAVLNTIDASIAEREMSRLRPRRRTPTELREEPEMKMPITGGKKAKQGTLPLPDEVLSAPAPARRRSRLS